MFQAAFSVVFPGVGFSVEIQTTNPRIVSLLVMQSIIKAFGSDCDYDGPSEMARLALKQLYFHLHSAGLWGRRARPSRSNLGRILHRSGDIAGYLCSWPHPYSTLIFVVFQLHQITDVGVSPSRSLKLFGREIIFQVFQPV